MEIRIANNQADAESASKIHALGWKSGYRGIFSDKLLDSIPLHFWTEHFNRTHETRQLALCRVDGEDIGAVTYGLSRDYPDKNAGEIWSFYFLEKTWGKGYAVPFMHFIVEQLQSKDCAVLYLWTLNDNIRAQRFYEKCYFRRTGNEKACTFQGETKMQIEFIFTKEDECQVEQKSELSEM